MIGTAVQKVKEWIVDVVAPSVRCHTVNVVEGLKCPVCGEVVPHVDNYEVARLLFGHGVQEIQDNTGKY